MKIENIKCPCDSNRAYSECCQPLHLGVEIAQTPEQLMRSRYSAYARGSLGAYLLGTWHTDFLGDLSVAELDQSDVNWLGLKIISTEENEADGNVEFVARFRKDSGAQPAFFRERSSFLKERGKWFYTTGEILEFKPPKRNEPCYCGSSKKFKRCCGSVG